MTSSDGNIFRVTGHLCGELTRSFDVFFDLCPNARWVNNREAGDLRRYRAHYDVIVMKKYQQYHITILESVVPNHGNTEYACPRHDVIMCRVFSFKTY